MRYKLNVLNFKQTKPHQTVLHSPNSLHYILSLHKESILKQNLFMYLFISSFYIIQKKLDKKSEGTLNRTDLENFLDNTLLRFGL